MIFVFKKWDLFCNALIKKGMQSIPAKEVNAQKEKYIVLKHDVETDVAKAYTMAKIESKYGHKGSYYVQAYLLEKEENVKMLKEIASLGHEVSYHYDVLDSNKGDIPKAITEFDKNKNIFEKNGFQLTTLCQHGNPVVERVGYNSNRDFFRNPLVQEKYPFLSDIMVDFKQKHNTDYVYFSDAGRKFKMIFDPINNDIINSDDKNVTYADLNALLKVLENDKTYIISTHPHRWCNSALIYVLKATAFKMIKFVAKILTKIPFCKKIMSRYYYLAKKI